MDDFREWLSDYLRYFELGGAILVVLLILFFGVRACVGGRGSAKEEVAKEQEETTTDVAETEKDVPVEASAEGAESAQGLEKADAGIVELIQNYFTAIQSGDMDTLNTLVDEISPSDEARIANSKDYISSYNVGDVYVMDGLDSNSCVVYATYTYLCTGSTTPVPSLVQFYVKKDQQGNYIIDGSAETDAQIKAYTNSLSKDVAVKALTKQVQNAYDKALAGDQELSDFLSGLGTESDTGSETTESSESKEWMVTNDDVNVRDAAAGDIIDGIEAGERVEIIGRDGDWYQIRYGSMEGYVYAELLNATA